jgi:hypothetical protein
MEVSGQLHAPAAFPPPGERASPPYLLDRWVDPKVSLDAVENEQKSSTAGNGTRAVQSVARRCTDWAFPTPAFNVTVK